MLILISGTFWDCDERKKEKDRERREEEEEKEEKEAIRRQTQCSKPKKN